MTSVGVVGATGYTGAELLRIIAPHPKFELRIATSRADAGTPVREVWPALSGHTDLALSEPSIDNLADLDLVFLATPNGTAMTMVPELLKQGVKVVDLSADFRLKSEQQWSEWYGEKHACPELIAKAAYGLPELFRDDIKQCRLVANPGCYPTAVVLALIPLLENELVDPSDLIADAKSGVSGAGRTLSTNKLYGEVADDFKAYAVDGHRHSPEIAQSLEVVSKKAVNLVFTPHLIPMFRGIHATVYSKFENVSAEAIQKAFTERYRDEPFVEVLAADEHPNTASVRGSNVCRISAHINEAANRVVVLSVIDNLVKGAAGQAVQNANLMCGFDETMGLEAPPLFV